MVKKMQRSAESEAKDKGAAGNAQFAGTVKESASQIWLAGLGAFAKAQEEGTKVFDALVKEGTAIQRKTQSAAEEKITEATSRMANMASDISSKASGQWDKLESIFEDRVSRALEKLGVPAAKDIAALNARIDELERALGGVAGTKAAKTTRPRVAVKKAVQAPASRRVARKAP